MSGLYGMKYVELDYISFQFYAPTFGLTYLYVHINKTWMQKHVQTSSPGYTHKIVV